LPEDNNAINIQHLMVHSELVT